MKTAKRVLAVIIAVIMIVSTCSAAASAAEVLQQAGTSLQATINAAQAGDTVKLTKYTTETVTINKDLTLDLNGYRLTGEYGSAAIKITKGKVTVTNGQVEAKFRKCSTEEMLKTVSNDCPPAIKITGGELILDGVRVVGGQIRVPTTPIDDPILVPAGSGVMSYNGAPVTIKRCSIYGDYGVNNNVRNSTPGGPVTVEDAIILAYNRAVKGDLSSAYYDAYGNPTTFTVAAGSQEIIAADRIAGVLNGGIRLEDDEKELVGNLLNERTMIVVKNPDTIAKILNDEANKPLTDEDEGYVDYYTATITVIPGKPTADVVAPDLDYTWKNTQGTDCSYKLVAEGVKMSEGDIVALDKVDATRVNSDCQVVYRVEYKIGDEARDYMDYVISDDPAVNKLDGCLGWAGIELDERYAEVVEKNSNNKIDSYDEVVEEVAALMWKIDNLGSSDLPTGGQVSDLQQFKDVRKLLYKLFGKTAYNNSDERKQKMGQYYEDLGPVTYFNLIGEQMPADGIVGTLDRIDALKEGLEATIGGSFKNTAKYGDLAVWFVDEAYPELIEGKDGKDPILDELIAKLQELKALLVPENANDDDPWQTALATLDLSDAVDLIDLGISYGQKAKTAINDVFKNKDVKDAVDYVKANKSEIKGYVDKAVEVIQNWRTYVTPSKFLVENNTFVKTFTLIGSQELIEEEPSGKLHIDIDGLGAVAFSNGTAYDGQTPEEVYNYDVDFEGSFTLTAIPEDDSIEFLYWANNEGGADYILSTEPTLTVTTNDSRSINAVFSDKTDRNVIFTNPTGDICAFKTNQFDNNGNALINNVRKPSISGYGFEYWGGSDASNELVFADNFADGNAALTEYYAGNSAFADPNAAYPKEGAVLLVNPSSSSYIVTPVYSISGNYTLTFYDAGEVYTADGTYSDLVTMTSNLDGDAYWIDHTTGKTVSVTKTISHIILGNAAFDSVAGTCGSVAAIVTTISTTDEKVIFHGQRSTATPFSTVGFVFLVDNNIPNQPIDPETDLFLTNPNIGKSYGTFTTTDGVYNMELDLQRLAGRKVYARPYIEYPDGVYYGDYVTFN